MKNSQKKRHVPTTEHYDTAKPSTLGLHQPVDQEQDNCLTNPNLNGPISRQDSATYIHDMAKELKILAEATNFSFLAYLLELAIEETAAQQQGRL